MMRALLLLAVTLIGGSCNSSTATSPSPPRPDTLAIVPSLEGLKLGETQALSAVVTAANDARTTVSAAWSTDAPAVVVIEDDGRVRGVGLGSAQVRATFGAMSASLGIGNS